MADESTYGFNKADAGELIQLIGSGATEFAEEWPGGGKGSPIALYKFEITDTFDPIHHDATVATANLTPITGGDPDNGAILRDPERIFTGLPDGARGLALLQGGNYYIIQAACPEEEEPEE